MFALSFYHQQNANISKQTPDGACLAVGEPMHDSDSSKSTGNVHGYTNIYKWINGSWTQKGQSIAGLTDDEISGFSISISKDCMRVVSGAPFNSHEAGRVRTFDYHHGTNMWIQDSNLDGAPNDLFGTSVAISSDGTRLAVGAVQSFPIGNPNINDPKGGQPGYVKVYDWTGTGWKQLGSTIVGVDTFDQLGYKIALSPRGDRLVIANLLRDGPGKTDSGSVRVIRLAPVSSDGQT